MGEEASGPVFAKRTSVTSRAGGIQLARRALGSAEGWAASAGLAFCLCSLEAWRFPVITEITHHSAAASQLCAIIGLAVLFLYFRFGHRGWLDSQPFILGCAALMTVSLYVNFSTTSETDALDLLTIGKTSSFAFGFILLGIWADSLYREKPTFSISIFVVSFFLTFAIQLGTGFLIPAIAKGTCALMPLFSALLLILYRRSANLSTLFHEDDEGMDLAEGSNDGRSAGSALFPPKAKVSYLLLIAALACYGILFKEMHLHWLPLQAVDWQPSAIQLISSLGALVAGLALLLLLRAMFAREGMGICESLMLGFALIALYCSAVFTTGNLVSLLYLVPLNAAQKILYFLAFYACLPLVRSRQRLQMFALLLLGYRVGSSSDFLDALVSPLTLPPEAAAVATAVAALVVLAQLLWSFAMPFPGLPPAESRGESVPERPQLDDNVYRNAAFYFYLCQKYGLTLREIDVLKLLEKLEGSQEVSEMLTISKATAKTHIRNIYAKLGVHSQKELVRQLQSERASFTLE